MPEAPTPDSERPIIAFFDVDNTLLRGASIFHIGFGAFRKHLISVRDILTFGWHQLSFLRVGENVEHLAVAKDRALSLVEGHSVAEIEQLTHEIFDSSLSKNLWPETVALAHEHLAKGHEVWLVTATPKIVAQIIADRLGFTGALGTLAEEIDGVFTGRLVGDVMHGAHKADAAGLLAEQKNAVLADCWAYSDSKNDLPLLTMVGHRVVVNPDKPLAVHAIAEDWPIMRLKTASIREAQRRVRREARAVKKSARR